MFSPDPFDGRSIEEVILWAETQYQKLANIFAELEIDSIRLVVQNAEPAHPRQGHIYYADGTNWNPGSGAGIYYYTGSVWTLLG